MRTQRILSAIILPISLFTTQAFATVNPADLIKVNANIQKKCVEYYRYQGELYCSTTALSNEPIDPEIINSETQNIVFDTRAWLPAWGQKKDGSVMLEYIPMGENINHWNELVTSQFIPSQSNASPKDYADAAIKSMQEQGFNPIITEIKNSPTTYLFEFRIESPSAEMQDELEKITVTPKGVYFLHYVIKKSDMGKKNRELWINNLSQSTIK